MLTKSEKESFLWCEFMILSDPVIFWEASWCEKSASCPRLLVCFKAWRIRAGIISGMSCEWVGFDRTQHHKDPDRGLGSPSTRRLQRCGLTHWTSTKILIQLIHIPRSLGERKRAPTCHRSICRELTGGPHFKQRTAAAGEATRHCRSTSDPSSGAWSPRHMFSISPHCCPVSPASRVSTPPLLHG